MKVASLVFLFLASAFADRLYYDGYKVYDLQVATVNDVEFLHNLMLTDPNLDFWEEPNRVGRATVMVAPEYQAGFLQTLDGHSIDVETRSENFGLEVRESWAKIDASRALRAPGSLALDLDDFNDLDTINEWVQALPAGACSDSGLFCEVDSIGSSVQGRPIYRIRVATEAGTNKPAFWVDSTIHAREWLAPATTIKVLNNLITTYPQGGEAAQLLNDYDWFFVLVVNPDGYLFSWTNQRMWRKNRSINTSPNCPGVDLNRNYDSNWGREGISTNPCSDVYCGPSPASEPETEAIVNEVLRVQNLNGILVFMSFHSFGRMWMHPWGNTIDHAGRNCERADDHSTMFELADATADAIEDTFNTQWLRGTSCEVIYATTGGSNDWAKAGANIVHSIVPELRGNSFVVDRSQIDLSFREIWNGLVEQERKLREMNS